MKMEDSEPATGDNIQPPEDKVSVPGLHIDLRPYLAQLHEPLEIWHRTQMQPFVEQMNALTKKLLTPTLEFQKAMQLLIAESRRQWEPISTKLSEAVRELYKLFDKSSAIMLELGWPPIGDFDAVRAKQVVQAYDSHGPDAVRPML